MSTSSPIRLRIFQVALTALCAASIVQSLIGLVWPQVISAHRGLMNAALSASAGVNLGVAKVPAVELYVEGAVCLAAVGLALALVWRAGARAESRALAIVLATAFFPAYMVAKAGVPYSAVVVIQSAMQWVYLGAFLRFAALFPQPLTLADLEASDRARAERKGRVAKPVGRGRRILLNSAAVWGGAAVAGVIAALAVGTGQAVLHVVLMPVILWSLYRGVGLLRASYAVADPVGQRRILWVVQGLYSMVWLGVVMLGAMGYGMVHGVRAASAGIPASEIQIPYGVMMATNISQSLSVLVMVVCLAFAIFFQGALDPRLALKRTTVYGMMAVSGALLFAVVENVASSFIADVLHLSDGFAATVAGGVVALGFNPARAWLTRRVENRLGGTLPDADPPAAELPAGVAHA
ncbi:MAG TPA: hypothetical protein VGB92_00620 [Longimicrobium sp.]|jgi:hypothetical protein